jgi:pSer/pThr/pTyr-binding forkhead associated (FHA) protein
MVGAVSRYTPGAHYNATRLFDLDFASVGHVGETDTTEALVDLPKGTGRIAYRKVVFRGNRLVGAMMLGHPEERVRQNGRLLKQVIDGSLDVQSIKQRLLDRGFDLRSWLKKDTLMQPAAAHPTGATEAAQAVMKGTHFFLAVPANIEASAVHQAPDIDDADPTNGGPASGSNASSEAVLDGLGTTFPLNRALVVIGRDPSSHVPIQRPDVELAHAHVVRFEDGHYLRDLGSRAGTLVNGEALVVPHRLANGDRIAIGDAALTYRASRTAPVDTRAPAATSMGHQARVEVRSGPGAGVSFTLTSSPTVIGSNAACAVFLQDPSVAERHAELRQKGRAWHVVALGGGTWLDGHGVPPNTEAPLNEGSVIQLGTVRLAFTHTLTKRAATRMQSANAQGRAMSPAGPPHVAAPAPPGGAARVAGVHVRTPGAPAVAPAAPQMRIARGPGVGRIIPVGDGIVVGRDPSCQLVLTEADIAPNHCEIRRHQGSSFVRDLGTQGRTAMSGKPLGTDYVRLSRGDWIAIGAQVVLVYEEP